MKHPDRITRLFKVTGILQAIDVRRHYKDDREITGYLRVQLRDAYTQLTDDEKTRIRHYAAEALLEAHQQHENWDEIQTEVATLTNQCFSVPPAGE